MRVLARREPVDRRNARLVVAPIRATRPPRGRGTTRAGTWLKHQIPIRTFADWDDARPGFLEGDLVAHCGPTTVGFYLHTLCAVDIVTGWTELDAVWGKHQERVGGAIHRARQRLPMPLLGWDSDSGSEFINEAFWRYCQREAITFTRGRAYRKKGMAREAERELAEAARLAPDDARVWTDLGHVLAEQKKFDEAAAAFTTALNLDPASEDAGTALGVVLVDAGKAEEAEAALKKAIEANAKSPALWNNLGAARVRLGDTAGAIEAFQKALSMDAGFDAARANLTRATEIAALEKAAS